MAKAKCEVLRRMLQEARLPDEFAANCVSIEDYVNIVTVKDYETELKVVLIDQCAATKDSPFSWQGRAQPGAQVKENQLRT